jgi:hypothetical protein
MERTLYSVAAMNKNIEAVQTPPIVTRPISKWGIVAVIATIVSRWWLSHHVDADVALRAVVALAPIPIWFMAMRSNAQRIRLVDEMQRLIFYKAWWFAGIGTMFVMIALWQVQLIGLHLPDWLSHGLDYQCTIILMVCLVFVGFIGFNRRYK